MIHLLLARGIQTREVSKNTYIHSSTDYTFPILLYSQQYPNFPCHVYVFVTITCFNNAMALSFRNICNVYLQYLKIEINS